MNKITLDKAIRTGDIQLDKSGNIISSKDIAKYPGILSHLFVFSKGIR